MRNLRRLFVLGLLLAAALPARLTAQTPVTLNLPREDATAVDGDRTVPVTAKRADSAATTASSNGKYGNLIADALGRLWVNCGTGCAGGTQYTHDGALTPSTTVGTMAFGRASASVPSDVSADNDGSMLWVLRSGLLPVTLVTNAGVSLTPATDATHGSAANTTGPQVMGYGSATAPTAVTAGQAVRAWYTLAGAQLTQQTDGTNLRVLDPCDSVDKTTTPISITTDTVIISATSAKKNYICSLVVVAAAAEIVSLTEGTGSVCGTSEAALIASTTDANGMSFAANGGASMIGGNATIVAGKTTNVDTCLNVSGSNRVAGFVTWVQR